jgi:hypothetical protein
VAKTANNGGFAENFQAHIEFNFGLAVKNESWTIDAQLKNEVQIMEKKN